MNTLPLLITVLNTFLLLITVGENNGSYFFQKNPWHLWNVIYGPSHVPRFFWKKDEPLFFLTVITSGNPFSTVITSGNVFPTVISSGNTFSTVITSGNLFPKVITSGNVFPTVKTSRNLFPTVMFMFIFMCALFGYGLI